MATSHDNRPVFNYKTDTPFIIAERPSDDDTELTPEYCDSVSWCELRDEADFLRLGVDEDRYGSSGNELDICSDETINLWFYVHNGTSENQNNSAGTWASGEGTPEDPFWNESNANMDGPAVARNTTIRLDVSDETGNSHTVMASLKSDNGNEVTDSVQINCSDETKQISLVYDEAETSVSTRAPEHGSIGTIDLVGDMASEDGAILGYGGGIVPSCFEFASVIRGKLSVVVTEATELVDDDPEVDEDPDDTPEGEDAPEEDPEEDPDESEPDEVGTGDEDAPEDIPPLGAGTATPLAAVVLSSVLAALGYRVVRSTRH